MCADEPAYTKFVFTHLEGAREWYNGINEFVEEDWSAIKEAFLDKFSSNKSTKDFLKRLESLEQDVVYGYCSYEENFLALLAHLD